MRIELTLYSTRLGEFLPKLSLKFHTINIVSAALEINKLGDKLVRLFHSLKFPT